MRLEGRRHHTASATLLAEVTHLRGERLRQFALASEEAAAEAAAALPAAWAVARVRRSQRQSGPPAPYNTASLQQDASRRLGMGVGRVMRLAQSLYELVEALSRHYKSSYYDVARTTGQLGLPLGLNGVQTAPGGSLL